MPFLFFLMGCILGDVSFASFCSPLSPPRLGLIFVVNDSEDVDGMQDAGVAILRAYNYVAQEVDDYHAFQILTHVCFCSKWWIISKNLAYPQKQYVVRGFCISGKRTRYSIHKLSAFYMLGVAFIDTLMLIIDCWDFS